MTGRTEIEERWQRLDPIFIMGAQRSGTSIMARAMTVLGYSHFGEGHLWFELMAPLARWRDPMYRRRLRRPIFALGEGRNLLLEKYIALAIDDFHRQTLPGNPSRWSDKSPGLPAVEAATMLARVFPRSQFIFTVRSGVSSVHSGLRLWSDREGMFYKLCSNWQRVMSTWREMRQELEGRSLEIRQEELVTHPEGIAAELTTFLGVPEKREVIAELFRSKRVNTAFPDRPPGDYDYQVDWSDDQKALFVATCGEEMAAWGYALPFALDPPWLRRWRKASHLLGAADVGGLWAEVKQYLAWRLRGPESRSTEE